jgi:predicted enzyme related to lactoylglutathione lyase
MQMLLAGRALARRSRGERGRGRFARRLAAEETLLSPPPRIRGHMKRVTGIGGVFFKVKDAPSLRAWYKRHLGIDVQVWGGAAFDWTDAEGKPVAGTTSWCIDPQESDHFAPSSAPFMVNYRVEDLHALVKVLKEEGCNVLEKIDESEYGKFAWVIDPEGNKVELWQPPQGQ